MRAHFQQMRAKAIPQKRQTIATQARFNRQQQTERKNTSTLMSVFLSQSLLCALPAHGKHKRLHCIVIQNTSNVRRSSAPVKEPTAPGSSPMDTEIVNKKNASEMRKRTNNNKRRLANRERNLPVVSSVPASQRLHTHTVVRSEAIGTDYWSPDPSSWCHAQRLAPERRQIAVQTNPNTRAACTCD